MHRLLPLLRAFRRNGTYSVVSIAGLGLAISAVVLIASHVRHQESFDAFHPHSDRLYQVTYREVDTPAMRHVPTVSPPVAPTMVEELPEVETGLRFRIESRSLVTNGTDRYFEDGIVYADSTLFDMLGFELLRGDGRAALRDPASVVLTESMARKYFGVRNPLGETITIDDERSFTVTGVMQDLPDNTHIRMEIVLPFDAFRVPSGYPVTLDDWQWISFPTFIRLVPGADPGALRDRLGAFMERHFPERSARVARLELQPIADVYLNGPVDPAFVRGNAAYLDGLRLVALLILVLSVFNYANLSSVQTLRRTRELGIRKALGASGGGLFARLASEAILLAAAGALFAVVLVFAAGRWAPDWVGADLAAATMLRPVWIAAFLAGAPLLGLLAGLYPALMAFRLDAGRSLKETLSGSGRLSIVRRSLVVLQFAIAVGLITAGLVISQQLRFISETDLGFEREHVLSVQLEGERMRTAWPAIRAELLSNPNVVNVAATGHLMDGDQGSVPMRPEGAPDEARAMNLYGIGYDFVETMGLEVVRGRDFDRAMPADSADAVLINESAARYFAAVAPGWEDPLGRWVGVSDIMEGRVIGVVRDFHFASVHQPIEPLVMIVPRADMDNVLVRVEPGSTDAVVASVGASWNRAVPDVPFDYEYLDDHLARLYAQEQVFRRLVTLFAALSVLIAALGLYGLAGFVCTVRTREIAIRKALGARVDQAITLLLRPFGLYLLLAVLLAWPLSWFLLDRWLDGFELRMGPEPSAFVAAGLIALTIGLVTVVGKTWKTAQSDPATVLASE